jgi:hypothetical protein
MFGCDGETGLQGLLPLNTHRFFRAFGVREVPSHTGRRGGAYADEPRAIAQRHLRAAHQVLAVEPRRAPLLSAPLLLSSSPVLLSRLLSSFLFLLRLLSLPLLSSSLA